MDTMMEKIAGKRYRIGWEEPYSLKNPAVGKSNREMYQQIPCKYGFIYRYGRNRLAWYCNSRKKGINALRELGDVLAVQVECDDEWIFQFKPEDFPAVAKTAIARRRRTLSKAHREKLVSAGKRNRFRSGA